MVCLRPILLFFVVAPLALCQNVLNQTGYNDVGSEFWGSGGAGIAERGVRATEFVNPSLLFFERPTVTLETGWRPKTDHNGIGYDATFSIPSYASIGIPFKRGAIEAGYLRSYAERFDLGHIAITTMDQPDGTGQITDYVQTTMVHTIFAATSYTPPHWLTIGVAAGVDFVEYDVATITRVKANGTRLRVAIGTVFSPVDRLNIGLSGHWTQDVGLEYNASSSGTVPVGSRVLQYANVLPWYAAETPTSYAIGASFTAAQSISLLAALQYEGWHIMESYLQDVWQYRIGVVDTVTSALTVRAGFFSLRSASNPQKELFDEYFLTAGCSWNFEEGFRVSLAFMTSELFTRKVSPSWFISAKESLAQRTLSVGLSFSW